MLRRLPLFCALMLLSLQVFAQENPPAQSGYVRCPGNQQYVYLYQSLSNFEIAASPKCGEKVEVLRSEGIPAGYLWVRLAEEREGFLPEAHFTVTPPRNPRAVIQPPPPPQPAGEVTGFPIPPFPRLDVEYDVPRVEVFGGYSYLNADQAFEGLGSRSAFHGWNGAAVYNLSDWLGLEADVSGHFKRTCAATSGMTCQQLTFMGGPRISYRLGRIAAFGHGLFGGGNFRASLAGNSASETKLAWAAGGGVDFAATELISVRLGQADYLMTRYDQGGVPARQNHFRISAGVVIRLGRVITE
jgi:opacity protein-like surface antigen